MQGLIAFDTETTGVDFWHGARAYSVQITQWDPETPGEYQTDVYHWPVDPHTRQVEYDANDLKEIGDILLGRGVFEGDTRPIVAHNTAFDLHAMDFAARQAGVVDWEFSDEDPTQPAWNWPWHRLRDTMSTAHMLGSCESKSLTNQLARWCNLNVQPFEDEVERATKDAIKHLKRTAEYQERPWALAKVGREDMPSAKGSVWKADMWVPKEVLQEFQEGRFPEDVLRTPFRSEKDFKTWLYSWMDGGNLFEGHPWTRPLWEYARTDPESTVLLYRTHMAEIERRGLSKIEESRRATLKLAYDLKRKGLTINSGRTAESVEKYGEECSRLNARAVQLAGGEEHLPTGLPTGGTSNDLNRVVFQKFGLKAHKRTKGGSVECMDKEVLGRWREELPERSRAKKFLDALVEYRQRQTAISYMKAYRRFWCDTEAGQEWFRLHPSLKPYNTRTLRWASSDPNEQNISKKSGFNLRYCFGPLPGRGWAAIDYNNLELRIPAYAANESDLIRLFEAPDDPPYYGSNHLLNFETVYPDLWRKAWKESGGAEHVADWIKKNWKDTWYGRCKNGGFGVQYGSVDKKEGDTRWSTADRAFGRKGCHRKLKERFAALEGLNLACIEEADRTGFVCTMPARCIDPENGYPLQCEPDEDGRIKPTQPLNTKVQGTACWVIGLAMERVQEYLDDVNRRLGYSVEGVDGYFMTLQVHDELVIDFPKDRRYRAVIRETQRIMERVGDEFGVPLTTGCDYHMENWSE